METPEIYDSVINNVANFLKKCDLLFSHPPVVPPPIFYLIYLLIYCSLIFLFSVSKILSQVSSNNRRKLTKPFFDLNLK